MIHLRRFAPGEAMAAAEGLPRPSPAAAMRSDADASPDDARARPGVISLDYARERRRAAIQAVRDALTELDVANRYLDEISFPASPGSLSRPNTGAGGVTTSAAAPATSALTPPTSLLRRERATVAEGDT